jgi:hypothetical protein
MGCKFTPENVEELFGTEAAEQEDPARLRKYFFKNKTYEDVRADLPLRILVAHKGIGKSAMFKVCFGEDLDQCNLSLWVRPDDLVNLRFDNTTDLNVLIRNWKDGLADLILRKIVALAGEVPTQETIHHLNVAEKGLTVTLSRYMSEKREIVADRAIQAMFTKFLENKKLIIYIDDLDRGWEGKPTDIRRISALLNALRDLSTDVRGLYFRVALRADVYFLVRTSDESTDKIERAVVWYGWTNQEIFKILVKRVGTFFGRQITERQLASMQQWQMAKVLDNIMQPKFAGHGHWENAPMYKVLFSLVRKRPRDLIKLCSEASTHARRRDGELLNTMDFENSFENYSQGRLQDAINEYRTELPAIERLLLGMKPAKRERKAALGFQYDTAKLLEKISTIQEQGNFTFASGKVASTKELAAFMYKINFLTARKTLPSGEIDRKYFEENRYLSNQFVEFGYDWEVHPAYRWSLQPDSIHDIFNHLQLSAMEGL